MYYKHNNTVDWIVTGGNYNHLLTKIPDISYEFVQVTDRVSKLREINLSKSYAYAICTIGLIKSDPAQIVSVVVSQNYSYSAFAGLDGVSNTTSRVNLVVSLTSTLLRISTTQDCTIQQINALLFNL